jgi:hypothetical protein
VAIEASFADGDDARRRGKLFDLSPIVRRALGDVIRLEADCGVNARILARQVDAFAAGIDGGSHRDERFDAGGCGPFDDSVAAVVELFLVDVSVRVEEHGSASS